VNTTTGVQRFHPALAPEWPRCDVCVAIPVHQWTELRYCLPSRKASSRSLLTHPTWILLL